jgi:hypothetical protein
MDNSASTPFLGTLFSARAPAAQTDVDNFSCRYTEWRGSASPPRPDGRLRVPASRAARRGQHALRRRRPREKTTSKKLTLKSTLPLPLLLASSRGGARLPPSPPSPPPPPPPRPPPPVNSTSTRSTSSSCGRLTASAGARGRIFLAPSWSNWVRGLYKWAIRVESS